MSGWLQDLRYGVRMLAKRPGTSIIAIVALSLGIGLTTTMFSIVQGVMLRGLPFEQGDRIHYIGRTRTQNRAADPGPASLHDFVDWRARQTSFESLAGYSETSVTLSGDGTWPERVRTARVTANLMTVLRVAPMVGRDLTEADAAPGAPAVALIGYRTWMNRFQGDRNVLGREIRLNGTPTTIVGVMPERFQFPQAEEIWMPYALTLAVKRGEGGSLNTIGRLRDGVTFERAAAELAGIGKSLAEQHPENKDVLAVVVPYSDRMLPTRIRTTFTTMLGAVLGVMLIACVNVTNLQLARAAERSKEVAVRTALGSGRWRIVRQLLAEGLVLSVVGAALGLALAQFGVTYFMGAIADTEPPFWIDVKLDPTVLAFATLITVVAALVSSVVPGLRVARTDANVVLKDDSRGATSLRMGRFGRWLVVVEVTVSCALLVVSGLMIRSILATSNLEYPFATRDVFYATLQLDDRAHRVRLDVGRAIAQIEERLSQLPGVRRAALSNGPPGPGGTSNVVVEGGAPLASGERQSRRVAVTPGFFDVLDVSLVRGRLFNAGDVDGSQPVAIVDEAFAALHMSDAPALGRRIQFPGGANEARPWHTVVGIVPTLAPPGQSGQPVAAAYLPFAQAPERFLTILARVAGDPIAMTPAVRRAVMEVSDQSPVARANSLAGEFWRRGWAFRLFGGLFLTFGAAALLLAAAGLYGVMSFMVRQRTQEIGVRMALGASRRGVLGMVLWQALWRVSIAVAIGLWPGWFVATQMPGLLAGNVSVTDPVVYVTTAVALILAGTLASLAPALRAATVDPLTALRGC
jgi:predicted permease